MRQLIRKYGFRDIAPAVTLRRGLLILALGTFIVGPARAQTPDTPERCKRLSSQQSDQSDLKDDAPYRKGAVDRIDFDGPIHLSDSDIEEVIDTLNRAEFQADGSGWIDELRDVGLLEAWQDRGYFQAKVTATARSVDANSTEEHFVVTAHVDEGIQYHVGDIQFEAVGGHSGIPESELREVFPLRGGELFSVSKVREGLQVLTKLYSSLGTSILRQCRM